jgi:hypothetical protein
LEGQRESGRFIALLIGMNNGMNNHPIGSCGDGEHARNLLEVILTALHHGLHL